jgi:hypothetical protein
MQQQPPLQNNAHCSQSYPPLLNPGLNSREAETAQPEILPHSCDILIEHRSKMFGNSDQAIKSFPD